jgi:hypothetical protein
VGGAGVVGLGIGTVFALGAKSRYDESAGECNANVCTPQGVGIRDEARGKGNLATIFGGVGAAALVGGVVLYLTAPSGSVDSKTAVIAGPGSVWLSGRF